MIKKLFYGMMAATMLFATSCQQEEDLLQSGDTISFEVSTPQIATRAYSDGLTADYLHYAVYDNSAKPQPLFNAPGRENLKGHVSFDDQGQATVQLKLATGKKYNVLFWASSEANVEDGPYTIDFDDLTMTVNAGAVCNDEARDAFYKFHEVGGDLVQSVTLKRPFAQLNIGTNDLNVATADGIDVEKTQIKVKAYNTLDLVSGDVRDEAVQEFALNYRPDGETFPVTGYDYLAMAYVLVEDKVINNVEFTYGEGTNTLTRTFNNIPLQRNHRTNIYGSLLTNEFEFNVEIDNSYANEDDMTNVTVFSAQDLQEALDNAPEGETTTIILGANIEANVTDIQKPGRKVVIEGNGNKYIGTIKVHSNSNHYADAALTIKTVNFETSTASVNVIEALENGSERYSCNITVEDCTFTATGSAVNTAVGVQIKASKNAKVIGCTATNMHSLIQAQSCDESVLVQGCTVNGKNGVAFKQVKSATVEGTTITAVEYGIRFDGNIDNYGIVVKNNNVTAAQPFIVRKMTGQNNTIALEGTNTLDVSTTRAVTDPAYQIVITNGSDDEAYVKPTGTYTLTGAENYLVYPRDYELPVASWEEFTAALAAGEMNVILAEDITYDANYQLQKNVTINLNGKSMTLPMINIHKNVTIKNGTINGKMYARTGCKATLEGLTFSGTISDNLSTEGHLAIQGGCDVYAKNCTFAATTVNGSQTRSLSIEGSSSGTRKFEDCDFKFLSWGTGAGKYKKNVYINPMNGTTTVDFTNCKFNGKAPNILFASSYALTNLTMSGCDNTAPTLEINRAKDTVTEVEWAHISSLIANNKFTQVRVFYDASTSEYIR